MNSIPLELTYMPIAYIEAIIMMLGAFIIGYLGAYFYQNKLLKKQQQEASEQNQSLRKRIAQLTEDLEHQDNELSYKKDRMDQDYNQVGFDSKIFSAKILDGDEDEKININLDSIGYASEEDKDDLQKIQGVGSYTEKKLNKLGLYTYKQISRLTEGDIRAVTVLIKFFPGRIKNDKWVEQAQNLIVNVNQSNAASDDDTFEKNT